MELINILKFCIEKKASDLHLISDSQAYIRAQGDIVPINIPPISSEDLKKGMYEFMTSKQIAIFEENTEIDFAINVLDNERFRVSLSYNIKGISAVFRYISKNLLTMEQLNIPPILRKVCHLDYGLILVTGSTGSGKSTTLANMIEYINHNMKYNIITIEDPIEYVFTNQKSIMVQRELHTHTKSFSKALSSAMRSDPDIIMIGELRDKETIKLALTAAETGHLVLSTLHTSCAASSIERIVDSFDSSEKEFINTMLANVIQCVVNQDLVKTLDKCSLVPIFEVLLATPAIRNLIREHNLHQVTSSIQTGQRFGMISKDQSIQDLIRKGLISSKRLDSFNLLDIDTENDNQLF